MAVCLCVRLSSRLSLFLTNKMEVPGKNTILAQNGKSIYLKQKSNTHTHTRARARACAFLTLTVQVLAIIKKHAMKSWKHQTAVDLETRQRRGDERMKWTGLWRNTHREKRKKRGEWKKKKKRKRESKEALRPEEERAKWKEGPSLLKYCADEYRKLEERRRWNVGWSRDERRGGKVTAKET